MQFRNRAIHLAKWKPINSIAIYVFLSPIFNSISKQGYASAFTPKALFEAKQKGIINEKVVALGGITAANINKIKSYGFGGVALLGDVWRRTADPFF